MTYNNFCWVFPWQELEDEMSIAEIIRHEGIQSVKLPAEFQFDTDTVSIRREGDVVVLEPVKATTWPAGFFESIQIDDPKFARPDQGTVPTAPNVRTSTGIRTIPSPSPTPPGDNDAATDNVDSKPSTSRRFHAARLSHPFGALVGAQPGRTQGGARSAAPLLLCPGLACVGPLAP